MLVLERRDHLDPRRPRSAAHPNQADNQADAKNARNRLAGVNCLLSFRVLGDRTSKSKPMVENRGEIISMEKREINFPGAET